MYISFYREGKQVKVSISPNKKQADSYGLRMVDCNREVEARIIVNAFNEMKHRALATIRRNAYEQGYRDAKAKRRKISTFYGDWDVDGGREHVGY